MIAPDVIDRQGGKGALEGSENRLQIFFRLLLRGRDPVDQIAQLKNKRNGIAAFGPVLAGLVRQPSGISVTSQVRLDIIPTVVVISVLDVRDQPEGNDRLDVLVLIRERMIDLRIGRCEHGRCRRTARRFFFHAGHLEEQRGEFDLLGRRKIPRTIFV